MSIYVIGDLHLSKDPRIDKPMDIFGESWVNHDKRLEEEWNRIVTDEDTVLIVGDISWGLKLEEAMMDLEWIDQLPGKKVIIKGNHDLWWSGINKMNSLFDTITFLQNTAYVDGKLAICGTRGWNCPGSENFQESDTKIYNREVLRLEMSLKDAVSKGAETIIGILHYPPTNDKKQPSDFTRLFEEYGVKKAFYGHLHSEDAKRNSRSLNLNGVSYKLVSLDAVDCVPQLCQL